MPETPVQSFKIDSSPSTSITIQIAESAKIKAENLPLSTWGSSLILANLLHRFSHISTPALQDLPRNQIDNKDDNENTSSPLPVLELGAGTSLVGLSAAAIWQTSVVLTDLPGIVPGLIANANLNVPLLSSHHGSVSCGSLDWTSPSTLTLSFPSPSSIPSTRKSRIIVAADTIYDAAHPELLSSAICTWLEKHAAARAILTYPVRVAYLDYLREFWEVMEGSGLECVEEGKEAGDGSFDDLAPYEWCVWRWKGL